MRFAPVISLLLLSVPCVAQVGFVTGSVSAYGGMAAQTNNPVSMVFEHKQTQTLTDGTHINIVSHESFYRDSLGRTREESEIGAAGIMSGTPIYVVTVQDPVARTITSWRTGEPQVNAHTFNRFDQNPQQRPLLSSPSSAGQSHVVLPVRPSASPRPQPKAESQDLGMQDVQGFACGASRTSVVFPVDFMGNDRPITTVTERCQSREFGRVLREYYEDPRSGTRTTTLQSVSRGEPDPSLFQPPPDYIDAKSATH